MKKTGAQFKRNIFNRLSIFTILVIAGCFSIFSGYSNEPIKPVKNTLLLVSFDAFRWDYNKLYKTPNLDRMAKEGVKAERLIPSFPTKTFPNHYSIATGLYPDHHGLIDNSFSATDLGLFYRMADRAAVENPAFYGGEPVWVTAEKQGIKAASFFWVGSEAPVGGKYSSYWKRYDENITYQERIDTVMKWLSYPVGKRPGLVTLYFDEPDLSSHDFGPVSPETGKIVASLDSIIGAIRKKISSLPDAEKISLIVLSDHGMGPVSPDKYINVRAVIPDRMISSITGGNPVYSVNAKEGKLDSILLLLKNVNGLKAWKKSDLPAKWNYGTNPRIPEILIVADSSWSLGTRSDASSITGGAHGYDNYNSDMSAIFYATGPAFKKNFKIKELNNVDIYNLICRILDIEPAKNDGNPGHIKGLLRRSYSQ